MKRFFDGMKKHACRSKLLQKGGIRDLYRTRYGEHFWLDQKKYLDKALIEDGIFEKESVKSVKKLVGEGDVAADVGANIGYYTVVLSRLVGKTGKVIAFEPCRYFRDLLSVNVGANKIENCEIDHTGLSDKKGKKVLMRGVCSSTMHWISGEAPVEKETVKLDTLDHIAARSDLARLDFIKADLDGHEPFFLKGAERTIERCQPIILLEVSHMNYLEAGINAWDFHQYLLGCGYGIFTDRLNRISDRRGFLVYCGNFTHSANIFIAKGAGLVKIERHARPEEN